jgi:hypothetical protein
MSDIEASRATTGQVRNILANELGLNRDLVREIVSQRVSAIIEQKDLDSLIERVAKNEIDRMVKGCRADYTSVRTICAKAAENYVNKHLQVSLK